MGTRRLLMVVLLLGGVWPAMVRGQALDGRPMVGMERMFGGTGAMMMPLVLKHAKLTPEQSQQVQSIMQKDRETLRTLFRQLEDANEQLTDKLFAVGPVRESDLAPDVQHIMDLRRQLMEQGIHTALAIRGLLTPEQVAQVSQLKDRIQSLHAEMRNIVAGRD
jgi:Spy/CpxP family protein refolding chaperone